MRLIYIEEPKLYKIIIDTTAGEKLVNRSGKIYIKLCAEIIKSVSYCCL